jgi:uroporphyrin-III C-methyltransferase
MVALSGQRSDVQSGRVWLVGAGPGDPELMTIKAAKILATADVVVHDGLVSDEILKMASSSARFVNVAKRKSRHTLPQTGINDLIIALAREGLEVVRLKGGDPFVFGRGGEELEVCRQANISCEIIPGLSAALAASASLQAPLTHRSLAQSLTFVTGHAAKGEPDLDWTALARPNQTVAIYMGLSTVSLIVERLLAAGRDPATPAAVVVNASRPDEIRKVSTLQTLAADMTDLSGPALVLIGEAMALARPDRQQHAELVNIAVGARA